MSTKETKYVLIPISSIGCGKTTISLALSKILNNVEFVSNDDMKSSSKFFNRSKQVLTRNKAVIMDKNNHKFKLRENIFLTFENTESVVDLKYICLNFIGIDSYHKSKKFWDLTTQRVFKRGDNHQSIKAESSNKSQIYKIMKMFVNQIEPVDISKNPDIKFDLVIDLQVTDQDDSSLDNIRLIIHKIHEKYPQLIPKLPSEGLLVQSYQEALQFKPTIKRKT
ncbi:hypothetical protein WICMUC_005026 [Wickerhamomyces mucosus]|uniref:Uncharacterized protein n=1 Tax=Wickerhamomyces mucosus TaxID=1378264 RepID=A0A9P8PC69_9ASCO|nr:hypothetical protein WICMUC_005026 [Wickerhamomyces mucosus]